MYFSYFDRLLNTLAECNNLDRLDLEVGDWDNFDSLTIVLKITNLKQLNLRMCGASGKRNDLQENIIDIANNLKQLQRFSIQIPNAINQEVLCEFVQLLPEFNFLGVATSSFYDGFYDRLADIRMNQNSRTILNVEGPGTSGSFIQHNNWVKMSRIIGK